MGNRVAESESQAEVLARRLSIEHSTLDEHWNARYAILDEAGLQIVNAELERLAHVHGARGLTRWQVAEIAKDPASPLHGHIWPELVALARRKIAKESTQKVVQLLEQIAGVKFHELVIESIEDELTLRFLRDASHDLSPRDLVRAAEDANSVLHAHYAILARALSPDTPPASQAGAAATDRVAVPAPARDEDLAMEPSDANGERAALDESTGGDVDAPTAKTQRVRRPRSEAHYVERAIEAMGFAEKHGWPKDAAHLRRALGKNRLDPKNSPEPMHPATLGRWFREKSLVVDAIGRRDGWGDLVANFKLTKFYQESE